MIKLKSDSKHYVAGRGIIFFVDLHKNNVVTEELIKDFPSDLVYGNSVIIDDNIYEIVGVETFKVFGDRIKAKAVGLIVKETKI